MTEKTIETIETVKTVKTTEAAKNYQEPLYQIYKRGGRYFSEAFVDRKRAHDRSDPVRHGTVITVAFVADGKDKGKWIVCDCTPKKWANGTKPANAPLYNFFGSGHIIANLETEGFGEIDRSVLDETVRKELSEELLVRSENNEIRLEVWKDEENTGEHIGAKPYLYDEKNLKPIGWSEFDGDDNMEYSYIYSLAIPASDVPLLLSGDDGPDSTSVYLPVRVMSELELLKAPYVTQVSGAKKKKAACLDAISRLWDILNIETYEKLIDTINNHK
jgi:hypothetical protein